MFIKGITLEEIKLFRDSIFLQFIIAKASELLR